jgi:hypothetical protein
VESDRVQQEADRPPERSPGALEAARLSPPADRVLRLQRQAGNRATVRLLARDAVTMDPLRVTSSIPPVDRAVSGLDQLKGQGVDPNAMSVGRDPADVRRNSPSGDQVLPFSSDGSSWDAEAILRVLGQYDTNENTDSDTLRCVQAAALGARIVRGPMAVKAFLSAASLDGMLSTGYGGRERTALAVLRHVRDRIESRRATFGDLSWAQEALHDLFYNDVSGTPLDDILKRVAPALDMTFDTEARSTWFDSPEAVLAEANRLAQGQQLLLNTWDVAFNEAFLQLEDQHINVPVGGTHVVNIDGRDVRLRRIDTSRKPAPTQIDRRRDNMHGHQLLIINDAAVGGLRLYEPEMTNSGRHLEPLTVDVLRRYFTDHPEIQMYSYMQTLGKLTPSTLGQVNWGS